MKVTPSYTQDYYLVVKLNLATGSTYTLKFANVFKTPDTGLNETDVRNAFENVFKAHNESSFNILCTSDGYTQAVSIEEVYFEAVARTIQLLPET